jgi:hypothetical protein
MPSGKLVVLRSSEIALYQSDLRIEAFTKTYANQLSIVYSAWRYVCFGVRRPAGVAVVSFTPTSPGS